MNRESFQNDEVASVLNTAFTAIKMDREQYPDADQYYNNLLVAAGGTAGWPLSAILMPDGTPVWLGNYVDKKRLVALLEAFAKHYKEESPDIEMRAGIYRELAITNTAVSQSDTRSLDATNLKQAGEELLARQDPTYGGVKGEQKFPNPDNIEMLWWFHDKTRDKRFEAAAIRHLDGMLEGTLYDPIYGGFFRYATSPDWTRPHFEKTLSDQAEGLWQYSRAYSRTQNSDYLAVALDIERFTSNFFRTKDGFGYINGLDSEYNGVDGGFYLLTDNGLCSQLQCTKYLTKDDTQRYMARVPQDKWGKLSVIRSNIGTRLLKDIGKLKRDHKIITEENAKMALALFALSQATAPADEKFAAMAIKVAEWLLTEAVDLNSLRVSRQLDDIGYLGATAEDVDCLRTVHAQLVRHKPKSSVLFARHSEILEALKSDSTSQALICDTLEITKD